jgi:DNA invertase Pin-like site-specific DNA recombinase
MDITKLRNIIELEIVHTDKCKANGCIEAACYIRQSKGEQDSMEAQIAAELRWVEKAERATNKVVHIKYRVWDKTPAWTDFGPAPKRPGMDTLNELIKNKAIELTLARELSRYNRIVEDLLVWLRDCRINGVHVQSYIDGIEGDCSDNQNFATVIQVMLKAATNSNESRTIGKRILENTLELKECGFWMGGLQTGYFPREGKYIEEVDTRGNKILVLHAPKFPRTHEKGMTIHGKILDPLPNWKEAVEEATSAILKGESLRAAGRALEKYGFSCTPPGSNTVESTRVKAYLSSPILIGYLSNDKGNALSGNVAKYSGFERLKYVQKDSNGNPVAGVEPVMDYGRWVDLQHALVKIKDLRKPRTPFLLQGLLTCERCGYGMTRYHNKANDFTGYICLKTKTCNCKGVVISMDSLDKYIVEELFKVFTKKKLEQSRASYEDEKSLLIKQLPEAFGSELAELNKKYDILTDLLLDEQSPTARQKYKEKQDELAAKMDALNSYKVKEPSEPNLLLALDGMEIDGYGLPKIWDTLELHQKTAIIRAATEGILIKQVGNNPFGRKRDGRFEFDKTRIVIWWRNTEKPAEWNTRHINMTKTDKQEVEAQV